MRKMFTILLSVMIFPKPFTLTHGIGALMVFFALALNVYVTGQLHHKIITPRIRSPIHSVFAVSIQVCEEP